MRSNSCDHRQVRYCSRREFLRTTSLLALSAGASPLLTGPSCRAAEEKKDLASDSTKGSLKSTGTGLVLDDRYLRHTLGAGHPESPERLKAIDGFAQLTTLMMAIAAIHSRSRVVSILEGGYNTEGLAMAVESHVKTLLGA